MSDIHEIEYLNAKYNLLFDEGKIEEWLDCFVPDGKFERSNGDGPSHGHDELRAMAQSFTIKGRHVTTGAIIDVDGDTATHTCYLQWLAAEGNYGLAMFGVYRDRLSKASGEWKFVERYLEVL